MQTDAPLGASVCICLYSLLSGCEVEEAVSRILYQRRLSTTLAAIIYLGR